MTIADYIPKAEKNSRIEREKSNHKQEIQLARKDLIISRAFKTAANQYEPEIAYALINNNGYFEVGLDRWRANPVDVLLAFWDLLRYGLDKAPDIHTQDIERNDMYKEFRHSLETQGIRIKNMSAATEFGMVRFSQTVARMELQANSPMLG